MPGRSPAAPDRIARERPGAAHGFASGRRGHLAPGGRRTRRGNRLLRAPRATRNRVCAAPALRSSWPAGSCSSSPGSGWWPIGRWSSGRATVAVGEAAARPIELDVGGTVVRASPPCSKDTKPYPAAASTSSSKEYPVTNRSRERRTGTGESVPTVAASTTTGTAGEGAERRRSGDRFRRRARGDVAGSRGRNGSRGRFGGRRRRHARRGLGLREQLLSKGRIDERELRADLVRHCSSPPQTHGSDR